MCDPVTLYGSAAGFAPTLVGGAGMGSVLGASSVGLIGTGGSFALGSGSIASAFSNVGFSTLLNVAGMATQAFGQSYSAGIAEQNMRQQADIFAYNAKVAENNALMAQYSAEAEADTFDRRLRALQSTQTVNAAASNVVIHQDSPLSVAADTAREGMLERLQILNSGGMEATAQRATAVNERNAASRARVTATTIQPSSQIATLASTAKSGRSLLENV